MSSLKSGKKIIKKINNNICCFISKKGVKCQNKKIQNSKYCYLSSHYPTQKIYNETIFNIKKEWLNETYSTKLFLKTNVKNNGWCFYESFVLSLFEIYKKTDNESINSFFKNIKNKKLDLDIYSKKLFFISFKWLKKNLSKKHEDTKEDIKTFLINTKEIDDIDEYFDVKSVKDITDDGELLEEYWGGVCEQYALYKIFNINIAVFIPTNFSFSRKEKKYKINIAKTVRKKSTRYKLSNCFSICKKESFLQQLYFLS